MAELRIVDGFLFHDEEEYQKALKEQKAVVYLKKQISGKNAAELLRIYSQLLEQKMFHTQVGYTFLHDLYIALQHQKSIPNSSIPTIDLPKAEKKVIEPVQKKPASSSASSQVKILRIMVVALLCLVIGMFGITLTSTSPTILDYETKLQNKYASWEQELSQREAAVTKREAEIYK